MSLGLQMARSRRPWRRVPPHCSKCHSLARCTSYLQSFQVQHSMESHMLFSAGHLARTDCWDQNQLFLAFYQSLEGDSRVLDLCGKLHSYGCTLYRILATGKCVLQLFHAVVGAARCSQRALRWGNTPLSEITHFQFLLSAQEFVRLLWNLPHRVESH